MASRVLIAGLSALFLYSAPVVHAAEPAVHAPSLDGTVFHGGGCRKSSPPGQCCHMEHATGIVHCH